MAFMKETNVADRAESKPGVKTSEFWTAALVFVANIIPAVVALAKDKPWAAAVFAALGAILPTVYVWGRAILKTEQAGASDVLPDTWEPLLAKVFDAMETVARALPARDEPGADPDRQ